MLWIKTNIKLLSIIVFVFLYLVLHIPNLAINELNPDAVNWHKRSEQFIAAIKTKDFEKTSQHYHPGVTIMWIVGVPVELAKQFLGYGEVYNSENYETYHLFAKLSLISVNLVLSLLLIFFLSKITGFKLGFLTVFLLNLEPFFLGNAKILHMDVLFSNFVILTLVLAFLTVRTKNSYYVVLSSFFAAMSVLTRSIGIGLIPFILMYFIHYIVVSKNKSFIRLVFVFVTAFMVITVMFFPALWVAPIKTIDEIFSRSYSIGVEDGHTQFYFGKETENPGFTFYPVIFLLRMSPFILLGFSSFLLHKLRLLKEHKKEMISELKDLSFIKPPISFDRFITVFYLGYFFVMFIASKKLDRYMLPLYFLMVLFSLKGYQLLYAKWSSKLFVYCISLLFVFTVVKPISTLSPYEFLYYSPLFKNAQTANSVVGFKDFGMGMSSLKTLMLDRYSCIEGEYSYPRNFRVEYKDATYVCPTVRAKVNVGIYTSKNLAELYGNTNTKNTRFSKPNEYNVYLRVINGEMPKKIRTNGLVYKHDASILIGDLELWRIYVRSTQEE